MSQALESFGGLKKTLRGGNLNTHWSSSLPNPFASQVEELYKIYPRAQIPQQLGEDAARPVVVLPSAPALTLCRQDSTKELGNWTPIQQRHEAATWICKHSSSLKLGMSSWPLVPSTPEEGSDVSPSVREPGEVPFIDFLGVGAA